MTRSPAASIYNSAHVGGTHIYSFFSSISSRDKCVYVGRARRKRTSSRVIRQFAPKSERLTCPPIRPWRGAKDVCESRLSPVPPDGLQRQRRLQTGGGGGVVEANFEGRRRKSAGGDHDGSPGYRQVESERPVASSERERPPLRFAKL